MAVTIFHKVVNNNKITIINKAEDIQKQSEIINARIRQNSHFRRTVVRK